MTGKTVEEAVEAACASLELLRDEVNYEVLEMPQKRLFGTTLAKVRVYTESDDFTLNGLLLKKTKEEPEESSKNEDEAPEEILEVIIEVDQEIKEEVIPQISDDEPEKLEVLTATQIEPEVQIKEGKSPSLEEKAPSQEGKAPSQEEKSSSYETQTKDENELSLEEMPASAQAAFSYLTDVAAKMNLHNLTFKAIKVEGGVKFTADGADAAILIGRRGETMEALQYLCLLVGNRVGGEYCKISLDVANYRIRREQSLESQARRTAEKVLKNRRSQTLDSMSAYERRIIHSTIQTIKGVDSESVGSDPNRRVVVFVEGDRGRQNSRGYKGRGNNYSNNRPRNDNQTRPTVNQTRPEVPKEQSEELEKNLYGKIDL